MKKTQSLYIDGCFFYAIISGPPPLIDAPAVTRRKAQRRLIEEVAWLTKALALF